VDNNSSLWDIIKTIGNWAWVPFGAYLSFRQNKNNKDLEKQEKIDSRISELEQQSKISAMQTEGIKETIKEIKDSIKDIRQGIEKLVDKLI